LSDPHALTLLPMKDGASRYRLAVPINIGEINLSPFIAFR